MRTRNLAAVALAAIVRELEDDPAEAGVALARLLGTPAPTPPRALAPAAPESAARRQAKRKREPVIDPEVAEMLDALVARHGSQAAVARATGVDAKQVSAWRLGQAQPSRRTMRKLRAALAAGQGEPDDNQGDEDERHDPLDLKPLDTSEAAALAGELVERYGSVEKAAESTGIMLGSLRSWHGGGPITARALARLRDAARAPVGRSDSRGRRARREASEAGEEPAGAV